MFDRKTIAITEDRRIAEEGVVSNITTFQDDTFNQPFMIGVHTLGGLYELNVVYNNGVNVSKIKFEPCTI